MEDEAARLGLPPNAFAREDESADTAFYAFPRLVTHIDDGAIAALANFYRQILPPGGALLDLMSSWVSHLPEEMSYASVTGLGMNAEELAANPRLAQRIVRDLNANPTLPFADNTFDAAMITVSVQYLQRPLSVLTECRRVLKPGAPIVISFSNRCFPTKAVTIWRALSREDHARLVVFYLERAGFTDVEAHLVADGSQSDPLFAITGRAP